MNQKFFLVLIVLCSALNSAASFKAYAITVTGGDSCNCLEPPQEAEPFSILDHSPDSIKIDWPKQFDLEVYIDDDRVAYFGAHRNLCYGNSCIGTIRSNEAIVSGLEPNKTYTLYVRSASDGAYSNFSEPVEFEIDAPISTLAGEIKRVDYRKESVRVYIGKAWAFLNYTLFKDGRPILERSGNSSFLLLDENPIPGEDHFYFLRTSNSSGEYVDSNVVYLSDLPNPITEIIVDQRTSSSITVSWPYDAKADEYVAHIDYSCRDKTQGLYIYNDTTQENTFTFSGLKAGCLCDVSITPKNFLGSSYSFNQRSIFTLFSNNSHFSISDGLPDSTEFRWGGEASPLFVAIRGYALYIAGEKSTSDTIVEITIRNSLDRDNVDPVILKIGAGDKTELINTPGSSIISVSQSQTQFEFISNTNELFNGLNSVNLQISYKELLDGTTINLYPDSQKADYYSISYRKVKDNNANGIYDESEPLEILSSNRIRLKIIDKDSLEFTIKDGVNDLINGKVFIPYKLDQLAEHAGELPESFVINFNIDGTANSLLLERLSDLFNNLVQGFIFYPNDLGSNDLSFTLPMDKNETSAFYQVLCLKNFKYGDVTSSGDNSILNKWDIRGSQ
jgi:hypothetical protein